MTHNLVKLLMEVSSIFILNKPTSLSNQQITVIEEEIIRLMGLSSTLTLSPLISKTPQATILVRLYYDLI